MAERAGTVSYELFCRLTRRVHFEYLDESATSG
jgi:alanine racemase